MTMWMPDLEGRKGPRYLAIADAIAEAITAGRLKAGDRMPTHRDLAWKLEVTVGTVSRAYAEAERRGHLAGEVGRGTFVREGPRTDSLDYFTANRNVEPGGVDFSLNIPAFKREESFMARTLEQISKSNRLWDLGRYQLGEGIPAHRESGRAFLGWAGMEVALEDVVLTCGVQHGMQIALQAVAEPGDTVLSENLTYPGIVSLAAQLHLKIQGLAMDGEGLLPEAFEEACAKGNPKVLYCVPTQNNPTTATMSEERRRRIAEIARANGVWIVEDDIYGQLPSDRPPPIAVFAPDRTFYNLGTSKCMLEGLRVGYSVVPEGMKERVLAGVRASLLFVPSLMLEVASQWIDSGAAEEMIARERDELLARHAIAARYLPEGCYDADPEGFQIWLKLPEPWRRKEFIDALKARGVVALSAEAFAVGRSQPPHAVRLCLSSPMAREDVDRGMAIVADLLAGPKRQSVAVI